MGRGLRLAMLVIFADGDGRTDTWSFGARASPDWENGVDSGASGSWRLGGLEAWSCQIYSEYKGAVTGQRAL
jgi:hypothetical protein